MSTSATPSAPFICVCDADRSRMATVSHARPGGGLGEVRPPGPGPADLVTEAVILAAA
ncbi:MULTISPECIES: hypothetical protein [unclassified Streptomyces]|uniref:hypothetical protein n=1 Tax=unclassified Streptomyces TaxID=2593676 RepID=UPI001447D848|nr:hypothetical protein [Streptomyces sp. A1136]